MSIDRTSNEYSNQEIIKKLRAIIDLEESKPLAERDVDLITECVDYLMELEQGVELTQEELEEEKQKIYAYNKNLNKPAKRLKFKGLLVAACFVILMLLANFIAIACGIDTISLLKDFGDSLVEMFTGEKIDVDNKTIIKGDSFVSYASLEEFLRCEDYSVLYPTKLPNNMSISNIIISNTIDGSETLNSYRKDIIFSTNSPNISIIVHTISDLDVVTLENPNLIQKTINGLDCYILDSDGIAQCSFSHNNDIYSINAKTYDDLYLIVSNLKEDK